MQNFVKQVMAGAAAAPAARGEAGARDLDADPDADPDTDGDAEALPDPEAPAPTLTTAIGHQEVLRFGLSAPERPGDFGLVVENGMAWLVRRLQRLQTATPGILQPIAQQQLGLAPATPGQYTAAEALKQRLGEERTRLPAPGQPPETLAPSPDLAPDAVKPQQQ